MSTKIEWCDETWNPIRARRTDATPADLEIADMVGWHCERVSAGCQHCYAETINERRFGTGLPYNRKSRDLVTIELDEKTLTQPLHWRRPRKVFVCSMTDLFGEWVPDEYIDRVFAGMALSPQHTFQILTKRPERMRAWANAPARQSRIEHQIKRRIEVCFKPGELSRVSQTWPLPNVWFGTSVEDQPAADRRIPELLATPAAVRFLSCEPLLGPVELWRAFTEEWTETAEQLPIMPGQFEGLDWIICGGESGPGARPCDIGWIRGIVAQCKAAGVAPFVKQDSGPKPGRQGRIPDELWLKEFPAVTR